MKKENAYFQSVYETTYLDMLRYVVIQTRRAADVEDILQNAYTKFYKRIARHGHDDIGNANAFMMRIVQHELKNYYRFRLITAEREESIPEHTADLRIDVADEAVNGEMLRAIYGIVRAAPTLSYKSFVLHYYFGMRVPEIAEALGLTESGVTSRLHRVRQTIRNKLEKEWTL